jgi:cytochrome c-type biogenesis protein CcmH
LRDWIALEAETRPGTPWRKQLTRFIETTAKEAGLNAAALAKLRAKALKTAQKTAGANGRGPSREDMARAKRLSPAQRTAMIRGMVDNLAARLKENPDDLAGWRRLARSYMVLREYKKAAEAYEQAARLAPDNVDVLVPYSQALLAAYGRNGDMPPKFVAVVRRINALQPDNLIGLWFLGMVEYKAGNHEKAVALWNRVLARLPKDAPERAALAKRIEMLKMKKK